MEKGGIGADRTEWNENGWRIEENGTNGAYLERKSSESRVTQLFGVYSSLQILDRSCVVNPLPTAQNSAFFMEKLLVFAGIITVIVSPSPPKHPQRLTKTTIQDPRYGNVLWVFFVQKRAEIGGRSFFCRSE